ncbi:MAG TPA: SMI1/KNR4 family protein [Urbifossiella sp.]|nr:SMI1/KNR4 family protein [Urbifossiella sp.]
MAGGPAEGALPDDYRAFLLAHNGGRPTLPRFTFTAGGEARETVLEWFLAVHDREYAEPDDWYPHDWTPAAGPPPHFAQPLEGVWADLRSEKPRAGVLSIGRDPAGNLIGIGHAGKRAGAVWFYDHETEFFIRLADGFTQ